MTCNHATKVLKFKIEIANGDVREVPALYGCVKCDWQSAELPVEVEVPSEHAQHVDFTDGCFACKVRTLELNTGDAGRADSMSQKKWDAELSAYRDARSQGIQPAGTTMKAINAANEASDRMGQAYNADSMPAAEKITKQVASVGKEAGVI